jgi:hypothetical protein
MTALTRQFVRLVAAVSLSASAHAAAEEAPQMVRVVVDQVYEYREASQITYLPIEGFELPVSDLVEDMLLAAGLEPLLDDDPGEEQATIRIALRGRAIGGTYLEPVRDYLYTGAEIVGDILVERPGATALSLPFASELQRPFRISLNLGYEDPANAPFDAALVLPGGFVRDLAAAVARTWGIDAIVPSLDESDPALRYSVAALLGDLGDTSVVPHLVAALGDDNARVRWEAAWSLGRLGDATAVPDLVDALLDESEDVRWFASWSLRALTGAEIGADHAAWAAWLETTDGDAGG